MQNKLWFKAKRYGWGWYPCSSQGWPVILAWFLLIIGYLKFFKSDFKENLSINHFIFIFISICILIFICYEKREKPVWRWGESRDK